MLRRLLGLFVLASLALIASPSAAFHTAPEVRAGIQRVTDLLLNRDVEAAEAECHSLLVLSEGEAAGKFCLGLVTLTRAENKDDPTPDLDRFLTQVAEAISAAEALERSQPADAEVKLLVGLTHGYKALVDGGQKNYLAAFTSLREAHRRFEESVRLEPKLVDAYYGIGLYNYALGRLPVLLKPLVGIVLPRGDAAHGLPDLERVAEQGTYLKMMARVALLHLYASREDKYAEALRLGRDLLSLYPGNPYLYFAAANAA